jgi:hypothetical protein
MIDDADVVGDQPLVDFRCSVAGKEAVGSQGVEPGGRAYGSLHHVIVLLAPSVVGEDPG